MRLSIDQLRTAFGAATRPAFAGVVLLAIIALTGSAHAAPAGKVALLPLDADARLEIYGQPIASEIARALVAGGVDVIVVGPKMAVPDDARLIVDGSIKGKGDAVTIALRIRNPRDGTMLAKDAKLAVNATSLGTIDRAATELSARLLPVVLDQLVAVEQTPVVIEPRKPPTPGPAQRPTMLVGLTVWTGAPRSSEPLRVALGESLESWVTASQRQPTLIDAAAIAKLEPKLLVAQGVERAVAFIILDYGVTLTGDQIPMARARVRVWICDGKAVQFDRIIHTDTIVGTKAMQPEELANRMAREVLSILRPHMRKLEPSWR